MLGFFIIVAWKRSGKFLRVLTDAIYEANRRKGSEKKNTQQSQNDVFDFVTESDSEVEVRNYQFKPALAGN